MNHLKYGMIFLLILFGNFSVIVEAQSIRRETISSFGSSGMINGIPILQTAGQPFSTDTYLDGTMGINPGFQQAISSGKKLDIKNLTHSIGVYPNPATDYIRFIPSKSLKGTLKITDANGKIIYSAVVPEFKDYRVQCENWTGGLYAIIIIEEDTKICFTSKIIVTK